MFWGQFQSREAARRFVPTSAQSSYSNPDLVELNENVFKEVHLFDWPVLFHLQKFIIQRQIDSLIDFGGHVGVKYYAFREHLELSDSFRWQVVDTPPMVRAGTRQAADDNVRNLIFFDSLAAAGAAPLLLCSGVLQYAEETLEELLAGLDQRPEIIILNKVPLCEDGGFYTLENFGRVKLVHRIFDSSEHAAMGGRMGYRRITQWAIPYRDFSIPFSRPRKMVELVGEVWMRSDQFPRSEP